MSFLSNVNFILWFLLDRYQVLSPPRGEGSLHPSTSHYTPGNGISSRASNYVEMVYSQSFGPFLSAGEKVLSVCQEGAEGGMPAFSTEYGGTRLLSETALHSHYAKNAFIAPSRRIYRAPLPCYALRSCVIKGIFGVGSCPLTRK